MKRYFIAFVICGSLLAAGPRKKPPADIVATINPPELTRSLTYSERDIPTIHTRLHYTTVFVLPKAEKVMDLLCGEKENWTINGADGTNFAYVKPERAGSRTNLNLVTASGNVYSFLLVEGDGQPDLKVFIQPKDAAMVMSMEAAPKWVPVSELDNARQQVELAKQSAENTKAEAQRDQEQTRTKAAEEIAAFRAGFPSSLKHDYTYKEKRNFGVRAIAHSDKFTYLWADPSETPALYELKDGKPSLINYQYENGVYVVPKVLDAGYLAVGKHKLNFKRED